MVNVLKKMKMAYNEDALAYLHKDMQVDAGKRRYKAISEEMVLEIIRPAFVKHGLIMVPHEINYSRDGNITTANVLFRIYDTDSGEHIQVACIGQGSDTQDKGAGMAMTYAQKHAFLKAFNIISGDDPDKVSSFNKDQEASIEEARKLAEFALNLARRAGVLDKYEKSIIRDRDACNSTGLRKGIDFLKGLSEDSDR